MAMFKVLVSQVIGGYYLVEAKDAKEAEEAVDHSVTGDRAGEWHETSYEERIESVEEVV